VHPDLLKVDQRWGPSLRFATQGITDQVNYDTPQYETLFPFGKSVFTLGKGQMAKK